jgi:hypothetical protein
MEATMRFLEGDQSTGQERPPHRLIHRVLVFAVAVFVGFAAGLLAYAGGADIANAALTGGSAVGGTAAALKTLLNGVEDNR